MERVLIRQREAGIIAPFKDRNNVTEITTEGMLPCYAFVIRDPVMSVALLAHVDSPYGNFFLERMILGVAPLLKDLGAHKVIVETANQWFEETSKVVVNRAVDSLDRSGLSIITHRDDQGVEHSWRDVGRACSVLVHPVTGITTYSFKEIAPQATFQRLELNGMQRVKHELARLKRLYSKTGFEIKYTPETPMFL